MADNILMITRFMPLLLLLSLLCFGADDSAWAQSCPGGQSPVCQKIGNSVGVLNDAKTKCIYTPLCSSTGKPPVNGACADVLVCPTGTTGTPPNNCETTDRQCPSNSRELPDGTCEAAPPMNGYYECAKPSVWDETEEKCLFDVNDDGVVTETVEFCPPGFYEDEGVGKCKKQEPCRGTNIWSNPCIARPDPGAICTQADINTPF